VVPPQVSETFAVLGETMFKKNREPFTMARMATAMEVLRAHPAGVPIRFLRVKVACGRDELSSALKNLRDEGLAENPIRGVWRAVPDPTPSVEAPASVGVADSYAEIHARAIAAEERAQGLAEKLAEEQAENKRLSRELRECGDSFYALREVRQRLMKRARRLRARLTAIEHFITDLDIKDPTIPF